MSKTTSQPVNTVRAVTAARAAVRLAPAATELFDLVGHRMLSEQLQTLARAATTVRGGQNVLGEVAPIVLTDVGHRLSLRVAGGGVKRAALTAGAGTAKLAGGASVATKLDLLRLAG